MTKFLNVSKTSLLFLLASFFSQTSLSLSLVGEGHYSLLGETRTHPGFDAGSGFYQAIRQNFRLQGELRASDRASFFTEFSIFKDPRRAYLGDKPEPRDCSKSEAQQKDASCKGSHQNSIEPGYSDYTPKIKEAYIQYAFDNCLLTAGRRSRDWGMGLLVDSGRGFFDTDRSLFDGISCDINIQKTQTLAFTVGYDKLAETGVSIYSNSTTDPKTFGATKPSDDLDQFYFTLIYDTTQTSLPSEFSQKVGFYFANIVGSSDELDTDIKIADLYFGIFMPSFTIQQEVIFRLGKSADPSWSRLGGLSSREGDKQTNRLSSIGGAGSIEYFLSRTGAHIGPKAYHEGNTKSHSLFFEYAYAPGDGDGYDEEYSVKTLTDGTILEEANRNLDVKAMAFHRNFKPALLLFNGPAEIDSLRRDGAFDPGRVVNATVFSAGYRYKSLENGNFEIKLVSATLNEGMESERRLELKDAKEFPVGMQGQSLGFELDLQYERLLTKDVLFGITGALATPGDAFDIDPEQGAVGNYLLQSFIAFQF